MSDHLKTGAVGEEIARNHLAAVGYDILEVGYRYRRVELDLIARKDDCLVFVEVKTRRGTGHGHPSLAVSVTKERNILRAAQAYMRRINHIWEVRFDIVAILLYPDGTHTLEHLEDAFFPGRW